MKPKTNYLNYKSFLILLVFLAVASVFILFKPFLVEIIIAAVMTSVFYGFYLKLKKILFGKRYLASFVVCLLLLLLIVLPAINLVIYTGAKAPLALEKVNELISQTESLQEGLLERFDIPLFESLDIKEFFLNITESINNFLVSGASYIVKGATDFLVSLVIMLLTMFFFFADGAKMVKRIKGWSPLASEYNDEITKRFKVVSRVTLISIFVTALAQGFMGALGFLFIGWPFIFVFIIMAALSVIPYLGSSIFYIPVSIYLILSGQVWQGIFVVAWCWLVVSNVDELIRAYIIKGKSNLNPIFIIFSIIGGISMFGFWGVVIGPITIALTETVLYIYEKEFKDVLDK